MEDIRKGVCPLCKHNKVIRAEPGDIPMTLARIHRWLGGELGNSQLGIIIAFACQRCGFTQLFTREPESVPIDEEYDTALITGPEPEGPYR
jgi:hypothetical protein